MTPEICPGCNGPKTKRARVCWGCRLRAIDVGVTAIIRANTERPRPDQLTDGQRRAFFAKTNELDRLSGWQRGSSRELALQAAALEFGRPFESVNDLSQKEASWVLDRLEEQIAASELAGPEADEQG